VPRHVPEAIKLSSPNRRNSDRMLVGTDTKKQELMRTPFFNSQLSLINSPLPIAILLTEIKGK